MHRSSLGVHTAVALLYSAHSAAGAAGPARANDERVPVDGAIIAPFADVAPMALSHPPAHIGLVDVVVAHCIWDFAANLRDVFIKLVDQEGSVGSALWSAYVYVYSKCAKADPATIFLDVRDELKNARELQTVSMNIAIDTLPNVGRNDHTYAYHLVKRYDSLRGATFFLKDLELSRGEHGAMLLQAHRNGFACRYGDLGWTSADNLKNFSLKSNYSKIRHFRYRNTTLVRSGYSSLGHWIDSSGVLNASVVAYLNARQSWPVCLGGDFAASADALHRIDRSTWRRLELALSVGNNVEVGHYMERLWAVLLTSSTAQRMLDAVARSGAAQILPMSTLKHDLALPELVLARPGQARIPISHRRNGKQLLQGTKDAFALHMRHNRTRHHNRPKPARNRPHGAYPFFHRRAAALATRTAFGTASGTTTVPLRPLRTALPLGITQIEDAIPEQVFEEARGVLETVLNISLHSKVISISRGKREQCRQLMIDLGEGSLFNTSLKALVDRGEVQGRKVSSFIIIHSFMNCFRRYRYYDYNPAVVKHLERKPRSGVLSLQDAHIHIYDPTERRDIKVAIPARAILLIDGDVGQGAVLNSVRGDGAIPGEMSWVQFYLDVPGAEHVPYRDRSRGPYIIDDAPLNGT